MKTLFTSFLIVGFLFFSNAQSSVKFVDNSLADEVLGFTDSGLHDVSVKFVKSEKQADFTVYLSKVRNEQDFTVERFANVDRTIRVKYSGSSDFRYLIKSTGNADINIHVSKNPNSGVYISSYDPLNEEEIISIIHQDILKFLNNN
ncbi:MAG: hypothetical protein ACI9O4_001295 [Chitinophagales bacterium]|jgi:hypothetical protein